MENDVASLAALKAETDALLSLLLSIRDGIYSRKENGESGLDSDFQFAESMSKSITEHMGKVDVFVRAHKCSQDGIILTRGSHAHEKLKELLDKIPRRLLKARKSMARLERHTAHSNRQA